MKALRMKMVGWSKIWESSRISIQRWRTGNSWSVWYSRYLFVMYSFLKISMILLGFYIGALEGHLDYLLLSSGSSLSCCQHCRFVKRSSEFHFWSNPNRRSSRNVWVSSLHILPVDNWISVQLTNEIPIRFCRHSLISSDDMNKRSTPSYIRSTRKAKGFSQISCSG